MSASIALTITVKETPAGNVSLKFQSAGTNMTNSIFAIELVPASATEPNGQYRFSHVCNQVELVEFPENTPLDNCYFRLSEIELILPTRTIANTVMETIKSDVTRLVADINAMASASSSVTTVTI